MFKKGQVTAFIIVGVVLFVIVSFIIISRSKPLTQPKVFDEQLKLKIINYVEGCLKQNLEESIALTKGDSERVSDMEDYIFVHLSECTQFNEPSFKDLKISKRLKDVNVLFNQDNSRIAVNIDYPLTITSKLGNLELKKFSTEIVLKRNFCFDVRVNNKDECISHEDKFVSSVGLSREVRIGDSLLAGGVCLAC
ncbi:hypothetical protein HYX19_02615 [Candidatus Woesearchaeota archaeon]|nr:hypothetical protein [Candidatus Woesearchaeota archaeon]